jgi:hypothetical protein
MCLLGLAASTVVDGRVGTLTAAFPTSWRAVILPVASCATFGTLWVVQFVVLDRLIFRTRATRAHRTERSITDESPPAAWPVMTSFANAWGRGGR